MSSIKNIKAPKIEAVHVGNSYFGYFELVHEPVTDVLYMCTRVSDGGNLTPLLNPETGLPMTLTKYMELLKNK